ncbi:actin filament-associated protein 1-like 2 isoform X2 [Zophobas morio]|uniref:actin filament-associated protein 1-like 2 isoform X2 n=1 Tax=Zophobas morio TaxID=2755281 RepID=UPI0030838BE4
MDGIIKFRFQAVQNKHYTCGKAKRREGRSLVPSARPPSSRAPSGRAHDHALRDIFPLRNPAGSFSHGSSTSRSPQPTPPPDYNTIEFYPQENDSLPTYEEALASEK